MHFWLPRPWTSSPPASSPLSGSSQLREAPGNHMLSQLGLPASNRDTLTLIHSTGEVLSLARRRESTNTETFTLHQIDSAAYTPSLLHQLHISLFLSAPPITICYSGSLSVSSSERAVFPEASSGSLSFFYCCLFDCVSSSSSFSTPPSVNISLCSSASLIFSLLFISYSVSALWLKHRSNDAHPTVYPLVFWHITEFELIPQTVIRFCLPLFYCFSQTLQ